MNKINEMTMGNIFHEMPIDTLPHLKCIKSVSVRSSLPCINIDVRIESTKN